jgi:hypothetical protein
MNALIVWTSMPDDVAHTMNESELCLVPRAGWTLATITIGKAGYSAHVLPPVVSRVCTT